MGTRALTSGRRKKIRSLEVEPHYKLDTLLSNTTDYIKTKIEPIFI